MADANILQGAIFHDDLEEPDRLEVTENDNSDVLPRNVRNSSKPLQVKPKQPKDVAKPAVHRVQFLDYYTYIYMYINPPTRYSCTVSLDGRYLFLRRFILHTCT